MKHSHVFIGVQKAPHNTIPFVAFVASLLFWALFYPLNGISGTVLPTPQVMVAEAMVPRVINSQWKIAVDTANTKQLFNANYLHSSLITEFSLGLTVVDLSEMTIGGKYILLGNVSHPTINTFMKDRKLVLDPRLGTEGYLLKVFSDNQILIASNADAGGFYGIQSLLREKPDVASAFQLLYIDNAEVKINGVTIQDWPDKPIRGMYLSNDRCANPTYSNAIPSKCSNENLMLFVEKMARKKMNYMFTGSREPSRWPIDYDELPGLFAKARSLYITPVPTPKGMAQGGDLISRNPHIAEGITATREPFVVALYGGKLVLAPEKAVDRTMEFINADMEKQVTTSSSTNPQSGWYFSPRQVTCSVNDSSCIAGQGVDVNHWTWDQANAHDGVSALKVEVPQSWAVNYPGTFSSEVVTHRRLPVEPGKTYTLSFWIKAEGISGSPPQVTIVQYGGNSRQVSGTNPSVSSAFIATDTYGWRQYFVTVPTTLETSTLSIYSRMRPNSYGRYWLDDFELRRMDGALTNVIRTGLTDIDITSVDGSISYTKGWDYTISDGVMKLNTEVNGIGYRFYPLNTPSQIAIPATSTLKENDHVLVSYDFALKTDSHASNNWAHCYSPNEPATYDIHMYPYIDRLMGELGSDAVFYSGSDEIRGINRDRRNKGKSNAQLIGEDVNRVYQQMKKNNPAALFFAWDDMVNPWHNGGDENYQFMYGGAKGASEPFPAADSSLPRATDFLPRQDFLHVVWWYDAQDTRGIIANSPNYFEGKGFEWIASPHENNLNILAWGQAIAGRPMNKGLIGTTWSSFSGFPLSASVAWNNLQVTRSSADVDADGLNDTQDNCPFVYNPDQLDVNNNGVGDVCEYSDLSLMVSATPNPVQLGNQIIYTATVSNIGPSAASGIGLSGLTGCTLPDTTLASGLSMSCSVTIATSSVGTMSQTVVVTGSQPDPNTTNNSATAITHVQGLLAVAKTGAGTVISSPAGINCGTDCSEPYNANTAVTLTATAELNALFNSWSGCDSSLGAVCTVNMNTSKTVTANFSLPDLAIASITAIQSGTSLRINDRVANAGGGHSGDFEISYYLSNDSAHSAVDTLLCKRSLTALAAGSSSPTNGTSQTDCFIPDVAKGNYYVIAVADSNNTVVEANEGNNISASPVMTIAGIDLRPTALTAARSGDTKILISDTVQSQGSQDADEFQIGYYLSTNLTYEATDIALVKSSGSENCKRTRDSLSAGSASSADKVCYKPTGAVAGVVYNVLVVVDSGREVSEYNENNNARASAGTLQW